MHSRLGPLATGCEDSALGDVSCPVHETASQSSWDINVPEPLGAAGAGHEVAAAAGLAIFDNYRVAAASRLANSTSINGRWPPINICRVYFFSLSCASCQAHDEVFEKVLILPSQLFLLSMYCTRYSMLSFGIFLDLFAIFNYFISLNGFFRIIQI